MPLLAQGVHSNTVSTVASPETVRRVVVPTIPYWAQTTLAKNLLENRYGLVLVLYSTCHNQLRRERYPAVMEAFSHSSSSVGGWWWWVGGSPCLRAPPSCPSSPSCPCPPPSPWPRSAHCRCGGAAGPSARCQSLRRRGGVTTAPRGLVTTAPRGLVEHNNKNIKSSQTIHQAQKIKQTSRREFHIKMKGVK